MPSCSPSSTQSLLTRWTGASVALLTLALTSPISNAGGDSCSAGDGPNFQITNVGAGAYVIDGLSNPSLTLVRGCTYTFSINAPGHPYRVKTAPGTGTVNSYNVGVSNNGSQTNVMTWDVALDAPSTLFYNCEFHGAMTGQFTLIDAPAEIPLFVNGFE